MTFSNGESRLVQIIGIDVPSRQRLYASSQLLHNTSYSAGETGVVSIHATPFGTGPPIPVARSVTLARVASPLLLDRRQYIAAVCSLKDKLENLKCLVKPGDVISVIT